MGVRKPMMKSKILNYEILIPFVTSWTPKTTQNVPKSPKRQISQLNDCFGLRMRIGEFFGWKADCGVRILIFWLFEGVRWHFDVKYDTRYHKLVQNVIQMMLECQQMIELSWKFVWIHISPEERDGGVIIIIFSLIEG